VTGDDTGRRGSRAPLVGAVLGVPVMAYGAWGAWQDPRAGAAEAARWLVGVAVVHDALWLPVIAVVTTLATRRLPAVARGPVAAALAASAVVVAVAWPYAARYGANPTVPSLLVRDVATGTAAYVAAIWAVAVAVVARRAHGARRP
jgi:hypothetical protein